MTLEEKVGQMNMPCVYESGFGKTIPEKMEGVQKFAAGTLLKDFGPGGGFFTLSNTILHEGPRQQAEFLNRLQRIALEQTRLGVPLLQTEEGTHGLLAPGATVFPEGPSLGSTWNTELIGRVYAAVAKETRSIGVHQNFTLVVEPIRDPRLGRNEEAYSEDPFLCADRGGDRPVDARQRRFRRRPRGFRAVPLSGSKPARQRLWSAGRWRSPSGRCGKSFCPRGKRASRSAGRWA